MQIGFKYYNCRGFGTVYNDAIKQKYMITKEATQRFKILEFWKKYGLLATIDAYGAKKSTLYYWQKIFKDNGGKIESLNPKSQARINKNKREIHPLILKEIRRLRLDECPNMGKTKVKKNLDIFCRNNNLPIYSESKIGRIIKDKKIYHHRQKISHFGKITEVEKRDRKERKPKDFVATNPGDLVEIDTIVKYLYGFKRYIITAVDVKTRYSFAYVYKHHGSISTKDFFKKLEQVFPYTIKRVQTDNGSEFHKYFMDYLKEQSVIHYFNYKGKPTKNGHIEKYNRTIQEEFIDWNEILLEDVDRFNDKLMDWLVWYNTKRFHWSLNLVSPVDYLINNGLLSKMMWTNTSTGVRFYVYTIVDVYSRWAYAKVVERISAKRNINFLKEAEKYSQFKFENIQTDHGPEFSKHFTQYVERAKMKHRYSRIRKPNDNSYVERFNRTIQEECFGINQSVNYESYLSLVKNYLAYYNNERLHLGLNLQTPNQVLQSY